VCISVVVRVRCLFVFVQLLLFCHPTTVTRLCFQESKNQTKSKPQQEQATIKSNSISYLTQNTARPSNRRPQHRLNRPRQPILPPQPRRHRLGGCPVASTLPGAGRQLPQSGREGGGRQLVQGQGGRPDPQLVTQIPACVSFLLVASCSDGSSFDSVQKKHRGRSMEHLHHINEAHATHPTPRDPCATARSPPEPEVSKRRHHQRRPPGPQPRRHRADAAVVHQC
jgi:hypothetical protein